MKPIPSKLVSFVAYIRTFTQRFLREVLLVCLKMAAKETT